MGIYFDIVFGAAYFLLCVSCFRSVVLLARLLCIVLVYTYCKCAPCGPNQLVVRVGPVSLSLCFDLVLNFAWLSCVCVALDMIYRKCIHSRELVVVIVTAYVCTTLSCLYMLASD